ncbi:MAG: hypothetical protein C5B60_08815 [Chloroflexi bacterium]|nr:MAG: hypothetical protein C5B60_08815 [Chloroflexota bacterium]
MLLLGIAIAQATEPITDRMRYEIARAQRDYLIAKQQFDLAVTQLRSKLADAEKACADAGRAFNGDSLTCVDKAAKP